MKTISRQLCKRIGALALVFCLFSFNRVSTQAKPEDENSQSIMLALLLDTSNSMDGLIDQAKSQLWKIVNELATAKCADGRKPRIKIALYEYGNDGLPMSEGYIRMVSPLTDDLDVISSKLFGLTTNGGSEFCGHVIRTSLRQLEWSESKADLNLIFIAGNEPFTQGEVPYATSCALAKEKNVVINTIYCGAYQEGLNSEWKNGADFTGGTFMSIEQDRKTVYIPSPYDDRINALNDRLNTTYIHYGREGESKKKLQNSQDSNAESYGQANKVERTISKSSHAYKNSSWDLVDAAKDNEKVIAEVKEDDLPAEMKGMTVEQRKVYIKQKSSERASIQKEIQDLSQKRQEYIATKTSATDKGSMLDAAMIKAIKTQAKAKNLSW
jgi:hypothetical protein